MALPLRDDAATRHFPWVTVALIAINILSFVFIQPVAFQGGPDPETRPADAAAAALDGETFLYRWGAVACEVRAGVPLADHPDACPPPCVSRWVDQQGGASRGPSQGDHLDDDGEPVCLTVVSTEATEGKTPWLALLTSLFLHADLLHLAGNLLFLWVFGNNVEDRLGPARYLLLYLVGGVVASLGFVFVNLSSASPLIGASGAVSAAMGAYLVFYPRARVLTVVPGLAFQLVYVPAAVVLLLYFVTQFFTGEGNVAWEAHAAGMAFGFVAGALLSRLPAVRSRAEEHRSDRAIRSGASF